MPRPSRRPPKPRRCWVVALDNQLSILGGFNSRIAATRLKAPCQAILDGMPMPGGWSVQRATLILDPASPRLRRIRPPKLRRSAGG